MELTSGARLGPYEILSPLGSGGMGEVWRARDTRLNREVAIKLSSRQFTDRFEREARAVAALNHPNICTLFDVGPDYLVMELIEGPTLAERIAQGPIPPDEALAIAGQIADALESAHEKNIIHRDLKPGNIKLRPDGSVKVLDFGLAKPLTDDQPVTSDSPTTINTPTQIGVILGTAGYMAPEQARGKQVDKRADIWSFGVVLYEMVTGKQLFEGETVSDALAAVLRAQPDLTVVPPSVRRVIARCLEKDPKRRLRDISVWRELLASEEPVAVAELTRGRLEYAWVVAGISALIAAGLAFVHFRERIAETRPVFSSIRFPPVTSPGFLAMSPDGTRLVIRVTGPNINQQLFVRALDSPQLRLLTEGAEVRAPFWSPDGRFVGFFGDGKLKTIPAAGGPIQELRSAVAEAGGSWSRKGVILFGAARRLFSVPAQGGPCRQVWNDASERRAGFPEFLPDSNHFFYAQNGDLSVRGVYLASLDEPRGHRLIAEASSVLYTPPAPGERYSNLLFHRDTTLLAQPFDEGRLDLAGDPFVVTEESSASQDLMSPDASASTNGMLASATYGVSAGHLVWLDGKGSRIGNPMLTDAMSAALSPDNRLAATVLKGLNETMLIDLIRGTTSRMPGVEGSPVWGPDSKTILYGRGTELYQRLLSGGSETLVFRGSNPNPRRPSDWSHDGRFVFYTEVDSKTRGDIWYLTDPRNGAEGKPTKFAGTEADESQAQLSPDGRWVVYFSDEAGRGDIFVRPFPSGQGQWRISTSGGEDPRWSSDGKGIYFLRAGGGYRSMFAASFASGRDGNPEIGIPQKLFDSPGGIGQRDYNIIVYAPARDGRFLLGEFDAPPAPVINLITNWWKMAGAK